MRKKPPTPPWKRPPPPRAGARPPLSPSQKAAARARAEAAGRRYPNLVDNMWARSLPRGEGDVTDGEDEQGSVCDPVADEEQPED